MFEIRQPVVCIDDRFPLGVEKLYNELPRKNVTYRIRDIVPGVSIENTEGEVAVYLEEIVSPDNKFGIERGFNAERFAPLTANRAHARELADATVDVVHELEPAFA